MLEFIKRYFYRQQLKLIALLIAAGFFVISFSGATPIMYLINGNTKNLYLYVTVFFISFIIYKLMYIGLVKNSEKTLFLKVRKFFKIK
ncbi:MAG TPA: hypothetical protein PKC68_05620 [Alphaproteobacteria bacterium]|nr:hypothetical protein [Alphaproteobacteria bacterium]